MNILWITLESVLPANSGGRLGVFKRLEQVSKTEKIYLFYLYDDDDELCYAKNLKEYCEEVYPYKRERSLIKIVPKLLKYPYTVASREISHMQKKIERCIKERAIDLINVDFPHMCVNLLKIKTTIPIILNEHNIEWKVYQTIASSQRNVLKKIAYWVDSFRLKVYEKQIFLKIKFDKITFVSEKDMRFAIEHHFCSQEKCKLIPVGSDKQILSNMENQSKRKNIIFVGKMSYAPNVEAVMWFVNEILPRIQARYENVKFYIVGKEPLVKVQKLAKENVVVTGMVDSVKQYYEQADLVVLPLKNGGGVKVKLLEAIGYGKMVVSTSVGVEGTIYADGETITIADEEADFADKCIDCLATTDEAKKRMSEAYKIYCENYTWKKIGKDYVSVMKDAVNEMFFLKNKAEEKRY